MSWLFYKEEGEREIFIVIHPIRPKVARSGLIFWRQGCARYQGFGPIFECLHRVPNRW
jgi:hypothetical protein